MNRYAYYALKCEQGDYAYTKAIEGLSFCGGSLLTFSCDFYYEKGYAGSLFSQEGNVACEIKNGSVCWSMENGTVLKSDSNNAPLWEKSWNHMDVVYTTDKITLYLNRASVAEKALGSKQDAGKENLVFGKDYPGYIRNVRIADFAFAQEDVLKNCVQTQVEKEKLLLYIPFDEYDVVDKGKNGLTVVCSGLARVTTLVGAIYFPGEGFAAIHGQQLNPGTAEMPEFTLALRVFLYPKEQEDAILFENMTGQEDGFVLKLKQTLDNAFLTVEMAGFSYQEKDIMLNYFEWQDLCVTVKEKQAACYINGELKKTIDLPQAYVRKSSAQIYLGNSRKGGKSLYGAIDYFGVYGISLTAERVAEIAKEEPYLYDEDLCSLYLFHGEGLHDLMREDVLSLSKCKQKLLEGTVFEKQIEPLTFRVGDEFPGDEIELWEADILLKLYVTIMAEMNGVVVPENIPGSIKWRLLQETASIQSVQDIFNRYDELQEIDVRDMIEDVREVAVVGNIIASMSIMGCAAGALMDLALLEEMEKYEGLWLLLLAPLVGYFVKEALKEWEPLKPPVPPIPPIPKLGYRIALESVQFCVEKGGSLPLRENFIQSQVLPEWTRETEGKAKMAYLAVSQKPSIQIEFKYIPAENQLPSQVILYGQSDVFGSFQSKPVTCKVADTYSTTAELADFKITEETLPGCLENEIKWSYNSYLGVQTFLQATEQQTHVIKSMPLFPWSLTDASHLPTIELLELVDKIGKKTVLGIGDASAFLKAMRDYLRTDTKPVYSSEQKYTELADGSVTDINMDYKGLFKALEKAGSELGALDVSAAAMYLAAMEGWKIQIMGFYGYEYLVKAGEKKITHSCGFQLNDMEAWGTTLTRKTVRHYTMAFACKEKVEDIIICDLVWNCKGSSEYLGELKLADYRNKVAKSTDSFEPGFIGYRIMEQEEELCQDLDIIFDKDTHSFQPSNRCDFRPYVKDVFKFPRNQACCHRLSYNYIQNILIQTFNKFKVGDITKDAKDIILSLLYNAFYESGAKSEDDEENCEELERCLEALEEINEYDMKDDEALIEVESYLQEALLCLNSALTNLRHGYSNWNSSIGDAYDLENYRIVFKVGDKTLFADATGQISDAPPEYKERHCYMVSNEDKQIWYYVKKITEILNIDQPVVLCAYRKLHSNGFVYIIPYAYSSNNEFEFIAGQNRTTDFTVALD